jgi:hypothetical protein
MMRRKDSKNMQREHQPKYITHWKKDAQFIIMPLTKLLCALFNGFGLVTIQPDL